MVLVGAVGQDGGDNLKALESAGVDVSRVVVLDKVCVPLLHPLPQNLIVH